MIVKSSSDKLTEKIEDWETEIVNLTLKQHPNLSGRRILVDFKDKDYTKYSVSGEIVVDGKIIFPFIIRERKLHDLDVFIKQGKYYSATKRSIMSALFDHSFFSRLQSKEEKMILNKDRQTMENLFSDNKGLDSFNEQSFALEKDSFDSIMIKKADEGWFVNYCGPKGDHSSFEKDPNFLTNFAIKSLFKKEAFSIEVDNEIKSNIRKAILNIGDECLLLDNKPTVKLGFTEVIEEMDKEASEFSGSCKIFDRSGNEHLGHIVDVTDERGYEEKLFIKKGGDYCVIEPGMKISSEPFISQLNDMVNIPRKNTRVIIISSGRGMGPFDFNGFDRENNQDFFDLGGAGLKRLKGIFQGNRKPQVLDSINTAVFPNSSQFLSLGKQMHGMGCEENNGKGMIVIKVSKNGKSEAFSRDNNWQIDDDDSDVFANKMNSTGFSAKAVKRILNKIKKELTSGKEQQVSKKLKVIDIDKESKILKEKKVDTKKIAAQFNLADAITVKFTSGKFDPNDYLEKLSTFQEVENDLAKMLTEMRSSGKGEEFPIKKLQNLVEGIGTVNSFLELVKNAKK